MKFSNESNFDDSSPNQIIRSISKGSPLRTRESATPSPTRTKSTRKLKINVAKKSSSDMQKKEGTPDQDRESPQQK